MPARYLGVKQPTHVHDIYPEANQDGLLGLRQLLHHVIDLDLAPIQAEVLLEVAVSDGGNARTGSRSEIYRDAVRGAVFNGGKDALA
jgi:hypothetical protein